MEESKKIQHEIVKWRRQLHTMPEVGIDLTETTAFITAKLEDMGIEYEDNVGICGIVGLIKGEKSGKVIALRSDMDGLPITEETDLEFASSNGNMHACGHDAHIAMLLGAAKILNENRDLINGTIKLIFQPDEEGSSGAKLMIKDGVMENPKVDGFLGLHIGSIFEQIGPGQIGISYGKVMASFDKFNLKIIGSGCHGAMPHIGIDPIVIAGQIINALQTIVSREINPTHPCVVTIGKINGGTAYNIIPEFVEIEGTFRALNQTEREIIAARIEEIAAGITKAMRGSYDFNITWGAPPVINNSEFTAEFVKSAKKLIGNENIIQITEPTMGGEDVAYYLSEVPGTFFFLGGVNEEKGPVYPHHNSGFMLDEDVFYIGTALLAQGAIDWLEGNK
ncbi:MAG: amidohydrolase [Eubacteriaceae bacterium]|nr:amidohydrolase [Eubacteriaceae bacterium]